MLHFVSTHPIKHSLSHKVHARNYYTVIKLQHVCPEIMHGDPHNAYVISFHFHSHAKNQDSEKRQNRKERKGR